MSVREIKPAKRLSLRRRTVAHAGPAGDAASRSASLAETLDRVLARGIVAQAEVVLAVANIPLVYVGLQAMVSSVETARELAGQPMRDAAREPNTSKAGAFTREDRANNR